ncbi:hypothetical protein AB9R81_23545 [Vibrio cyclitrophicus]|jgi:hypothetical protein|uniref:Uncharacterized protein n=1 Tax=Vibrio splendidus TaxID=29497 RepID=A0A0H3ZVC8_VIBSP|nr:MULTISPECIES: hypothetical protein [Vibrio]AKN37481.1 hypothetical protein [Vibrio splendidus]MDP2503941.1 hypothetical protein [Vibrio splendidus]NOH43334.1 hypothetical protein [Vibrio cyclitrophicus]NOI36583.1 hypothetical protein [Vibrio cyclitrophicus]OMO22859.1 hypothetical protein BH581_03185 [Vibrio splendidus]
MKITFNLFRDNLSWDRIIHQLNGDVLRRHVLVSGNVDDMNVKFSYCEATLTGSITDQHDCVLGNFSVLA